MTMGDLISRDAVIKILNNSRSIRARDGAGGVWIDLMDAIGEIERVPAVEAEPVRHGTWEMRRSTLKTEFATLTGTYPTCNLCGHVEFGVDKSTPYCPGCGAKMDGGNECSVTHRAD